MCSGGPQGSGVWRFWRFWRKVNGSFIRVTGSSSNGVLLGRTRLRRIIYVDSMDEKKWRRLEKNFLMLKRQKKKQKESSRMQIQYAQEMVEQASQ